MNIEQIKALLQRYQSGKATLAENEIIESWYQQLITTGEWQWAKGEKEMMEQLLEARIMKQLNEAPTQTKAPVFSLKSVWWWAAASAILVFGAIGYFILSNQPVNQKEIAKTTSYDIDAPQLNRAMITLANGQKVYLDSAGNGSLAIQGNMNLVKLSGGAIAYEKKFGEHAAEMEYNVLSNPNGSKVINMLLADGSKVWLNAGSSMTYPVSFIGRERKVSVTGEAYFEISHNASMPFIVSKGSMDIRVLGTHFNVNTFEDDGTDVRITLLEGSVKINNGNTSGLLKPGQQARIDKSIKIMDGVNLDAVMAWKNGYFHFDNASLQNVLKEVARWYDINIVYEGKNNEREFVGEIQRDLALSEVLKILEKNKVQFKISGKTLFVSAD